jgi:hypothetical protein
MPSYVWQGHINVIHSDYYHSDPNGLPFAPTHSWAVNTDQGIASVFTLGYKSQKTAQVAIRKACTQKGFEVHGMKLIHVQTKKEHDEQLLKPVF